MSQKIYDEYVTSSVGKLYHGCLLKSVGDFRVYACTSMGTREFVGYCACDSRGVFGPVCVDTESAVWRAHNVVRALKHKRSEKQR